MTAKQAAERLGISKSLLYQLVAEKRLPHRRIGGKGRRGKIVIEEEDVRAFMEGCKVEVGAEE